VDDHPVLVQGVEFLLRDDPRIQLVGSAKSATAAVASLGESRPDVILLDLRLPDMLASEAIHSLTEGAPQAKILLFTAHGDHPALRVALSAGAHGVLLKDAGLGDLAVAIVRTANGESVMDPRLVPEELGSRRGTGEVSLTKREYEILRRVAMGQTNPEIADALFLSRNTVKTYLQTTLQKLGARNRVDAIVKAGEQGIL
jgi:DNA-binding NarL/FixJ family response regulator